MQIGEGIHILQDCESHDELHVLSEGILILSNGGTRKGQAHNFMYIGSNIDDYKYSFFPQTRSQNGTNFQVLLSTD